MKICKLAFILVTLFIVALELVSCIDIKGQHNLERNNNNLQIWETTDSIDVFFDYENFYGVAVVKLNRLEKGNYRKLLIYKYTNQGKFEIIKETSYIFGKPDWGIKGGDAFGSISMRSNRMVLTFVSGDPINRFQQNYSFNLCNYGFVLTNYIIKEYNIMDVDGNGSLIKESIEEYDLINNIHSSFKLINGEKLDLIEDGITPKTILIGDIDAENGIKF